MNRSHLALVALAAVSSALLTSCGKDPAEDGAPADAAANPGAAGTAPAGAAPAAGSPAAATAAPAAGSPPFKPIATLKELMSGPIDFAATTYWNSVMIVVDTEGTHEHFPETDEEWHEVWAAAMTVAESGNLLMIAPRGRNDPVWIRLSEALMTTGVEAAEAAKAKNPDLVFDAGEKVYNVCKTCHELYIKE